MARLSTTPMPRTPQAIMRRANTARIASALQPGARPLSASVPTNPGPALLGPPIHQPPQGNFNPANPNNMAAMSYEALMRSAGMPVEHTTPIEQIGIQGFDEPQLPSDPSPPDPIGSGETYPLPPSPFPSIPPGALGPGDINPATLPPDNGALDPGGADYPGEDDYTPSPIMQSYLDRYRNQSGISGQNQPHGNYFPTFGGGPHVPGSGGQVGVGHDTTRREPWHGRVARALMPYGTGQLAHLALDYARRHGSGTVGGAAHAVRVNQPRTANPRSSGAPSGPAWYQPGYVPPQGIRDAIARGDYERAYGPSQQSRGGLTTMMMARNLPNLRMLAGHSNTGDAGRTVFSARDAHDAGGNSLLGRGTVPDMASALARGRLLTTNRGRTGQGQGYTGLSPEVLRMMRARGG